MLKEIILPVIGALCGLGVTLMAAAAPIRFPNAPPWAVHAAFWGGIALIAIMILDAALLYLWKDSRPRLGPGLVINLAVGAPTLALVWHYSPRYAYAPVEQKRRSPASLQLRLSGWIIALGSKIATSLIGPPPMAQALLSIGCQQAVSLYSRSEIRMENFTISKFPLGIKASPPRDMFFSIARLGLVRI